MKSSVAWGLVGGLALMMCAACASATEKPVLPSATAAATVTVLPSSTMTSTSEPTSTAPPTSTPPPLPTTTTVVGTIYAKPGNYLVTLISRNAPRTFKVHVPPGYNHEVPMPLVINMHGLGSSYVEQEMTSEMTSKADQAGFIVVYPQAGAGIWNIEAGQIGAIDVNFINQMLDLIESELTVDPRRIYATGFSNGGGMAHRLGCDLSDRIAAIAPVSAAPMQAQPCDPGRPVPVVAFHGTGDVYAPYLDEARGYDIHAWISDWARRNGCDPEPEITAQQGDVTAETWGNCQAGATVRLYTIDGGKHIWPGSWIAREYTPEVEDISATEVIWTFFLEHPMP
jgi:polyhydroxybutyrate depolymerase